MTTILGGARGSPLSRAQFDEVSKDPRLSHVCLKPVWVETMGDKDKKTSLRDLGNTDFFTKELDEMVLQKKIRFAVHSAKDLPDPLPEGLTIAAMTEGVDPRDCLVFRPHENLDSLPKNGKVGVSSVRREEMVRALREDLAFVDVRGTIGERLLLLENRFVDALAMAEAAIIRLGLHGLNRMILPGKAARHQGRLAVVIKSGDEEMLSLFSPLNVP